MDSILSVRERECCLSSLSASIREHEQEICAALHSDLGKSPFEAVATEIAPVQSAIHLFQRKLKKWVAPRRVPCAIANFPASGKLIPEPYGQVLIFSAWNYPFSLMLEPFIGAFAAGNSVVLKPSEHAPATEKVIKKVISGVFPAELVRIETGGLETAQRLLGDHFDFIFYTGGINGGKAVARAAAEHLTPIVLELGGKSPCIVDADASLKTAVRRIVWGKFLNCGQTCVAPDYLLVHSCLRNGFAERLKKVITSFYGADPKMSPDYARIVNTKHFDRLCTIANKVGVSPVCDREIRFIAPTIIEDPPLDSDLMREEIFGPILPVLYFDSIGEAAQFVKGRPKPLALYYFGQQNADYILQETSSGSVCINDCVMQIMNPAMPFGGIGASGMGAYHGRHSFDTFTHWKPVMEKPLFPDLPVRYPPSSEHKLKSLKRIMK